MLSAQTAASSSSSGGVEQERSVVVEQERSVVVEERRRTEPVGEEDEEEEEEEPEFRDIHALSPPPSQPSSYRRGRGESWGSAAGGSRHTSIRSVGSETAPSEPFPTMSREFSAMVAAAATANAANAAAANGAGSDTERDVDVMGRIGEGDELEETNPLAIVPDSNPIPSPRRRGPPTPGADGALAASGAQGHGHAGGGGEGGVSVGQVKKEEVESKIAAWQIAEVAKLNNRFKREEVVINGWEGDQVEKASAWLKKYEVIDHQPIHYSTDQTPNSSDAIPDPALKFLVRACRGSWRRSVPRRWRRRRTRWPRRGGRRRRSARRRRPSGAPRWRACWSSPTS
uniref:Remorin C-terminal domain-containing protein n=1 Tax=Setaria italica TaxID=4555 RepID=K4A441_SETIT